MTPANVLASDAGLAAAMADQLMLISELLLRSAMTGTLVAIGQFRCYTWLSHMAVMRQCMTRQDEMLGVS